MIAAVETGFADLGDASLALRIDDAELHGAKLQVPGEDTLSATGEVLEALRNWAGLAGLRYTPLPPTRCETSLPRLVLRLAATTGGEPALWLYPTVRLGMMRELLATLGGGELKPPLLCWPQAGGVICLVGVGCLEGETLTWAFQVAGATERLGEYDRGGVTHSRRIAPEALTGLQVESAADALSAVLTLN